jgi:predicted aspartyl protease
MPPRSKRFIPLAPDAELIVVQAVVKGPSAWQLLDLALDTGTTLTLIPPETAVAIGYDPAAATERFEITVAGAQVSAPVITVKSLTVLGRTVRNLQVICHTLPSASPVNGLLGLNFLRQFNVLLRFRSGRLELTK